MRILRTTLLLSAVMFVVSVPVAVQAADETEPVSVAGLGGPLTEMPQSYQRASQDEGAVVGIWRAITGTTNPADATDPTVAGSAKKPKPKPLTLNEYLNAQAPPGPNEQVKEPDQEQLDALLQPDEKAPPAGTWLQYGF